MFNYSKLEIKLIDEFFEYCYMYKFFQKSFILNWIYLNFHKYKYKNKKIYLVYCFGDNYDHRNTFDFEKILNFLFLTKYNLTAKRNEKF